MLISDFKNTIRIKNNKSGLPWEVGKEEGDIETGTGV